MTKETTREKGAAGEALAEKYLVGQGYAILGRNLSCRYGEIDLVAKFKANLYFVEIRRRVGAHLGTAIESISIFKQRRLRRTAEYLLSANKPWRELVPFFSVLTIDEDAERRTAPRIEFLPDAFV